MFKFLVTAFVALTFVGCSFDKDNNGNATQAERDNQKALQDFAMVKGLYAGTMTLSGMEYKIRLNLDAIQKKSERKDNNGQPMMEIVRLGNLKRISPASTDYTFDVSFSKELRTISLVNVDANNSNPQNPALGKDDIHTINAIIYSEQNIRGNILNKSAEGIGSIDVTLVSKESSPSNGKQDQERYDNLRKEYEALVGVYIGNSVKDGKAREYKMTIQMRPQPIGDVSAPQLYGTFVRTDDKGSSSSSALNLTFIYQNTSDPHRLFIEGKPVDFNRLDYVAKFDGVIQNNAYIGDWSTYRGFEGSFEFIKQLEKPAPTPAPTPKPDTCAGRGNFPCLPDVVPTPMPRPKMN